MKKILLLIFLNSILFSEQISIGQARIAAENFMSANKNDVLNIDSINTYEKNGTIIFYYVNFNPSGFVIIGADNRIKPILGYSFKNNFSVAYNVIQALVPLLTDSMGSIITIGSIAGLEDVSAPIPYAASKAALMAYTKSLSRKLADKKIRVNMVSPGNILFPGGNWDKKQKSDPYNIRKMLQEKVPLEMFGSPEDIGNVVAFLLSSKASFITGANIVVDGGQTTSMN